MTAGSGDAYEEWGDWDEDRVRERPNPRGSRPRTKQRPGHTDAVPGFIVAVDRGRATALVDEDEPQERQVLAATARELGKQRLVPGDRVDLVGDVSGEPGTLARIVRLQERRTLLRRSADDSDRIERVIVAGADRMCIVTAAAQPEPRPRLIDRCLVAAYDAGIEPLVVITKTDIASPAPLREALQPLQVPVFESQRDAPPLAALRTALAGHVAVLVGHSGVGKSTLVNALVPEAERATGAVNLVTGRGRHTSSSSRALPLRDGERRVGWIIDTPGLRSFGLGHVHPESVLRGFPDLAEIAAECPRGCTHREDAPDCELDAAAADGRLDAIGRLRLDSLRRLLRSATGGEDPAAGRE